MSYPRVIFSKPESLHNSYFWSTSVIVIMEKVKRVSEQLDLAKKQLLNRIGALEEREVRSSSNSKNSMQGKPKLQKNLEILTLTTKTSSRSMPAGKSSPLSALILPNSRELGSRHCSVADGTRSF